MDHRPSHAYHRNQLLVVACAMAIMGAACAARPKRSGYESGGAGGDSSSASSGGSGGSSAGGSSSSSKASSSTEGGKAGDSSPGGASGGTSGGDTGAGGSSTGLAGSSGVGGTGGTVPATVPKLTCTVDTECPSGRTCKGGTCVNPQGCSDSLDCASTDLVCDPNRGLCVQCVHAADCASGQSCLSNRCTSPATCQGAGDGGAASCGQGKVCDPSGRCVECSTDADCGTARRCIQNVCRAGCDSDKDCTPNGMLCNLAKGVCAQCSEQRPCASGNICDSFGTCGFPVCLSGESRCVGNGIASCATDGAGFGTVKACLASQTCKVYGGVAECLDLGVTVDASVTPDDGGVSDIDGGNGPISVGPRTCGVSGTATPCASIPNLIVTQTIDGKGDEFCDIPAFHLNAETAKALGKVLAGHATPTEDAAIKVAWTAAGLAVFIEVADVSVQSVSPVAANQAIDKVYQGDSIELFVASSNDVKGFPGADSNTLHITIPAEGPAVVVKTTGTEVTHSAWATSQYKQLKTTTGYTIEAQIPWPGNAPSTGSLVRFDIGLNSADKSFGGVDDMRDGQLLYYVGTVATSSCQASDGTVPFCDDRTWCTTLLQ
jgi:hypothetical protein